MLPVVEGAESTVKQIWIYTLITVVSSLVLIYPLQTSGVVYLFFAVGLGFIFIVKARKLQYQPDNKQLAKSLFKYSILYMMLLCTGMVIDSLPWVHEFDYQFNHQLAMLLQNLI
jgi:protoheme IX farnesyltransferase